jgi:hypothetical protein
MSLALVFCITTFIRLCFYCLCNPIAAPVDNCISALRIQNLNGRTELEMRGHGSVAATIIVLAELVVISYVAICLVIGRWCDRGDNNRSQKSRKLLEDNVSISRISRAPFTGV